MINKASPNFWKEFDKLPAHIQKLARHNFELFKLNPHHPSLNFKKIGNNWSVRIGIKYRALAREYNGYMIWFWIGPHATYDYKI